MNLTSMNYWLPKIAHLAIPMPKTEIPVTKICDGGSMNQEIKDRFEASMNPCDRCRWLDEVTETEFPCSLCKYNNALENQ